LQAISGLKTLFAPVLPFTSQRTHKFLGLAGEMFGRQFVETYQEAERSHIALSYDGSDAIGSWQRDEIPPGHTLPQPEPLFRKLDESVAEEELARLGR
jgi:methionyl-tRNA synthetase